MIDIPTMTDQQLEQAKNELNRIHADCPNELQGGRTHDTYFVARLTGKLNLHYCRTCGKDFQKVA